MPTSYDLNDLRYAVFCLRLDVAAPERVQEALDVSKGKDDESIGEHLIGSGLIGPELHAHLQALLEAHLDTHGGSVESSLRALTDVSSCEDLISDLALGGDRTAEFETPSSIDLEATAPIDSGRIVSTDTGERFLKLMKHRQGGMGEIYRARDVQLNRVVALKQLQERFIHHTSHRDRFVFEGQVTGKLEHPGIVPVYAMGENADDLPYYVMRYIDGETLTEAIRRLHKGEGAPPLNRVSVDFRDLLGRFIDACHAIDFAHSRSVLHRDLKPDNIMLGKYQETLVVDWGLAMSQRGRSEGMDDVHPLLDDDLIRRQEETMAGSAIGTPSYMSPEQAKGDLQAISATTDVFNLGATLFHILTNKSPFQGKNTDTTLEFARRCQVPEPRSIVPNIPRSLEAIVLKAMAEEPSQRYASAGDLASDVERWLADDRVLAAPDPITDRVARWTRRHRGIAASIAVSLVLISLVTSGSLMAVNSARQKQAALAIDNGHLAEEREVARRMAQQRFVEARETVDLWLTGFSEASRFVPAVQGLRRGLLEKAAVEYERFAAKESESPEVELERARTLLRLAEVYRELGQSDDALGALDKSKGLLQKLTKANPDDAAAKLAYAICHNRLALVHRSAGDFDKTLASLDQCISLANSLTKNESYKNDALELLGSALSNKGELHLGKGELDLAESFFADAITKFDELKRLAPDNIRYHALAAHALLGLGHVFALRGNSSVAMERYEQAVLAAQTASMTNPGNHKYEMMLADCQMFVASAARNLGDRKTETEAYAGAAEAYARLAKAWPSIPDYEAKLAAAKMDQGQVMVENGHARQAVDLLKESQALCEGLLAKFPNTPGLSHSFALATDNLAHAQLVMAEPESALKEVNRAITQFEALVSKYDEMDYDRGLAVAESHAAQTLAQLGEAEKANDQFQKSRDRLQAMVDGGASTIAERHALAVVNSRWGDVLTETGQAEQAAEQHKEAAEQFRLLAKEATDPLHHHATAWFFLTCPSEATRDLLAALESATVAHDASPTNRRFACALALYHLRKDQSPKASALLDSLDDSHNEGNARVGFLRAMISHAQGENDKAQSHYSTASNWLEANAPGDWELSHLQKECEALLGVDTK